MVSYESPPDANTSFALLFEAAGSLQYIHLLISFIQSDIYWRVGEGLKSQAVANTTCGVNSDPECGFRMRTLRRRLRFFPNEFDR